MKARVLKETIKHRRALAYYIAQGPKRSLQDVARQFAVTIQAVGKWSTSFGWAQRVADADAKAGDKAISQATDELAEMNRRQLMISRGVQGLYAKRLQDAVDKNGKLKSGGYKPTAFDAKMFMDLEREIHQTGKGGGAGQPGQGAFSAEAVDDIGVERLERIIIERVTRLTRSRKQGDPGSGIVGMGPLPGDA